jgi:UDP-glucose/GDP-mannose dehydrogenase family, NAD binding domain
MAPGLAVLGLGYVGCRSRARLPAPESWDYLRPGMLVVLESTSYPDTTDEVMRPLLEHSGVDYHLAFSPDRIDPGNAAFNLRNTSRSSAATPRSAPIARPRSTPGWSTPSPPAAYTTAAVYGGGFSFDLPRQLIGDVTGDGLDDIVTIHRQPRGGQTRTAIWGQVSTGSSFDPPFLVQDVNDTYPWLGAKFGPSKI